MANLCFLSLLLWTKGYLRVKDSDAPVLLIKVRLKLRSAD